MKKFTDPNTGVQTSLQGLTIQGQNDGWTLLQNDNGDILSFRFYFHFFNDRQQIAGHIENEIQQVARNNDLAGSEGLQNPNENTVTGIYYQFIDNVSHMVFMAARIIEGRPGIFYTAVTKSESMINACQQLFFDATPIAIEQAGKRDVATENKLSGHKLRYLHGYTSNTMGGGGMSTDKSFSLFGDGSFRYSYSSVISMGSLGGSTSENSGVGTWQVQKKGQSLYLILYWHIGSQGVLRLEWGEPGIVFVEGEKYLLDNL